MRQCIQDAKAIINAETQSTDLSIIEIANGLFNKRADAIFSVLQRELENYIAQKKNE